MVSWIVGALEGAIVVGGLSAVGAGLYSLGIPKDSILRYENGAPIGGLKVIAENRWFAARPSGTEDIYKIYAESFQGAGHLGRILKKAQTIIGEVLTSSSRKPEILSVSELKENQ